MSERRWQGYLRPDGRLGVRNLALVVYTVECAGHVAQEIARGEPDTHVIGFPGCYDNAYAIRLMLALARHPNVGAALFVGLGCEYTQPRKLAEVVQASHRPADWFFIQDRGGTLASVAHGRSLLAALRERMHAQTQRTAMGLGDLTVGVECGGSDATSGLAGNPAVGAGFDVLVDAGGRAVFEETVELLGLREILCQRARSPEAADQIRRACDKAADYCRSVRQYSVSPGNFAGGLTTIEEKSMGACAKAGTRPIEGVLRVAQTPPHPGLWLLDSVPDQHFMHYGYTNPNDSEGLMDLIAAGSQVVLFVTGRGSLIGCPIAPLIKVTGNRRTYERMKDDIDFDASPVLEGALSIEDAGARLIELVARVAAGQPSRAEALGHREYYIPYKHQNAPSKEGSCHD